MTPGELAEEYTRYVEEGGKGHTVKLAAALVDMRAAVHAIHHDDGEGFCIACYDTSFPCETWTAVEAVWGGDR